MFSYEPGHDMAVEKCVDVCNSSSKAKYLLWKQLAVLPVFRGKRPLNSKIKITPNEDSYNRR